MGLLVSLSQFFDSRAGKLVNFDIHMTPDKRRGRKKESQTLVRHRSLGHSRTEEAVESAVFQC